MSTATATMLDAALWYASRSFPVFPCGQDKRPLTPSGFKDATTDEGQIKRWWSEHPEACIGVPTGEASGLLVVDIDPRNNGDESLEKIISVHGRWPDTAEQITGGGGRHLVFRHKPGVRCGVIAHGIDRKAEGGYIIVAPSFTTGAYIWDGLSGAKALLSLADAPTWACISDERKHTVIGDGEVIPEGSRNAALASLAGTMRRRGMGEAAIEAALQAENSARCRPLLPCAEVRRIAASIATYEPISATAGKPSADEPKAVTAWPEPMAPEAFHGLAGELVHTIEPHSEADAAGLLIHGLVAFGNLTGRGAYFNVGGTVHRPNLNAICVGATASRKGTAKDDTFFVIRNVDVDWFDSRIQSGLSSGEGLVWAVRDAIEEQQAIKERGRIVDYQMVVTDPGIKDKRLLLVEPEFGSTLRVLERDGNTLSAQIRQAWDSGNLRVLTKTKSARASDAHISIVGHVTREELLKYLAETEQANGFANRFLWVCVRRSKLLPDGGELHHVDLEPIRHRLSVAAAFARKCGEVQRSAVAKDIWHAVYPRLAGDRLGLFGAVTSRAEAQVMRLALVYALLDRSSLIEPAHLNAALAVWTYCENSARFIFGDAVGDSAADELLKALRASSEGMTRTDISNHFGRNKSASQVGRALTLLSQHGLVYPKKEDAGTGRPAERWFAVSPGTKETNLTKEVGGDGS